MTRRVSVLVLSFLLAVATAAGAAIITVPAGGNLQQALNQAQPGDTILLAAGATYTGNFILPAKNGTAFITIRSDAPDASLPPAGQRMSPAYANLLPKLQAPSGAGGTPPLATAPYASYYIIQFVEFLPNPSGTGSLLALGSAESSQNTLAVVPHDIVVDRCYLHSYPGVAQLRGIALNSASTTIRDSYLSEFKYAGLDAQAIAGWNGPGPYTILNNYLQAAGEVFMMGGSSMFIPNTTPSNIQFRNNYVTKDPNWRGTSWTVKNIFELKHAQDVIVDGNIFEYNWQASQPGYAIVLTPRNQYKDNPWTVVQRVTFTNNIVRHVAGALNLLGWDDEAAGANVQTNHLTFRNNVFEDVSGANWGGDGRLLLISEVTDVTLDHNTSFNGGNAIYAYYGIKNQANPNFVFTNNIANTAYYGITGDSVGGNPATAISKYFPGSSFRDNAFVAPADPWNYPAGNFTPTSWAAVGFVDLAAGDYHLAASSPYKGVGTDGKDLGADIDALNAALAGTYTPPPPDPTPVPPPPPPDPTPVPPPPPPPPPDPTPTPSTLPAPWVMKDIGAVGLAGSASYANATFTVNAAGADVWGTSDAFGFVYQTLTGDGQIVLHVGSLSNTNDFAKAGAMFRASLDANAANAIVNVRPNGALEFLARASAGATTTSVGSNSKPGRNWLKLVRSRNTLSAFASGDGRRWMSLGKVTVTMGSTIYVGLAVCSHDVSRLATAAFDSVTVTAASTSSSARTSAIAVPRASVK